MNPEKYLERLHYDGAREPNASTLRALHIVHLFHVPFENLDIHLERKIVLEHDALFEKIVTRKRGGFCYEVNGMFAWLLRELGFTVTLLSARDVKPDGAVGPEYDHLTLLVKCPADAQPETRWLADVGWGDSFVEPLLLDVETEQPQGLRAYRIERADEFHFLWQRNYDGAWERQYRFTLQPRAFSEFEAMCEYHQTSPLSSFTRRRIITRATPRGRVSLDETRLILTKDGAREERAVAEHERAAVLWEHFGVTI